MSQIATRSNHVSINAMLYEPDELKCDAEIFIEKEVENKRMMELLSRLFHATSENPKNLNILELKLCEGRSFSQIAPELKLHPETIRKNFRRSLTLLCN